MVSRKFTKFIENRSLYCKSYSIQLIEIGALYDIIRVPKLLCRGWSTTMSAQSPEQDINVDEVSRILKEEEIKRSEPMLSRFSHGFGKVEVYAPFAPVSSWKDLPWVLKVERFDSDGQKRFKVKPDRIMDAFESPGLVESHKYLYEEPENAPTHLN